MKIAVIGSGISGLSAAWLLNQRHEVTLIEGEGRLGGHSNTATVGSGESALDVDTGFIVYNTRTYPNLIALFEELGVATETSDMSFSVSADQGRLEYAGSFSGLTAQPGNLLKPDYWSMLADLVRFYRQAPLLLSHAETDGPSLGAWLQSERYGKAFIDLHLLPMAAAIWSCPVETMMRFPARSFVQFFVNHGLLDFKDRPEWRTVTGGSKRYVAKIEAALEGKIIKGNGAASISRRPSGVEVTLRDGSIVEAEQVVLATHGDQALRLLEAPSARERELLGAFQYQDNRAYLHCDPALMPKREKVWASWNYLTEQDHQGDRRVALTYWMNRLQNLEKSRPVFVSLNPPRQPKDSLTHAVFDYEHPIFDQGAIAAQQQLDELQGIDRVWYCGSYCGWGFHEDGLKSAIRVALALGAPVPWTHNLSASNSASAYANEALVEAAE